MFLYAAKFSWWWDFGKVTNSHPMFTLAATIIKSCQDQIGLGQPETLSLCESSWANALCNMVPEDQKGIKQSLETKCLTAARSVDEGKCACQVLLQMCWGVHSRQTKLSKVRQDRKSFNIMRMNPFYMMKLHIPSSVPTDHREKLFKETWTSRD